MACRRRSLPRALRSHRESAHPQAVRRRTRWRKPSGAAAASPIFRSLRQKGSSRWAWAIANRRTTVERSGAEGSLASLPWAAFTSGVRHSDSPTRRCRRRLGRTRLAASRIGRSRGRKPRPGCGRHRESASRHLRHSVGRAPASGLALCRLESPLLWYRHSHVPETLDGEPSTAAIMTRIVEAETIASPVKPAVPQRGGSAQCMNS